MKAEACLSSSRMDWETPAGLFRSLDAEFEFDLDPCCAPRTAKCARYFTEAEDGLSQRWDGAVFMNPPYGRGIGDWVAKAYRESLLGCTVVCLIPSRTDTTWWHRYVMRSAEVRLIPGRVRFVGADGEAPFPSAIVVFKPGDERCAFSSFPIERFPGSPTMAADTYLGPLFA